MLKSDGKFVRNLIATGQGLAILDCFIVNFGAYKKMFGHVNSETEFSSRYKYPSFVKWQPINNNHGLLFKLKLLHFRHHFQGETEYDLLNFMFLFFTPDL